MSETADPLIDAPPELMRYFEVAQALRDDRLGICPLDRVQAREYTQAIRRTDVGAAFGLFALDDANDSNPYCFVSCGPARGMVLHLSHDAEPQLKFDGLTSFVHALTEAKRNRMHIDELPRGSIPPAADQDSFAAELLERSRSADELAEVFVCTLLPLLDSRNLMPLTELAAHPSFFIRESVALFIRSCASSDHLQLAQSLALDKVDQVARPAKEALRIIRWALAVE